MASVKIKVDLENREKLRRLHTATHIINFCSRKVLGNHIWQNGSNLKPEEGTLDITHYENLTSGEIFQIEKMANHTIFENKKVTIEELDRKDAEKKYGYILYQGGVIPKKKLRIINVLDSDIEACGGIHMESTGGIGLIKIIESSKIQDGVVRLKYVVRDFALERINNDLAILSVLSELYGVQKSDIVKTSQKFFIDWKEGKKEIDKLKEKLQATYGSMILVSNDKEFKFDDDLDMGTLTNIFNKCLSKKKSLRIEAEKFIFATSDFKEKNFKKEIDKKDYKIYIK